MSKVSLLDHLPAYNVTEFLKQFINKMSSGSVNSLVGGKLKMLFFAVLNGMQRTFFFFFFPWLHFLKDVVAG
jgi:hypothetical protein